MMKMLRKILLIFAVLSMFAIGVMGCSQTDEAETVSLGDNEPVAGAVFENTPEIQAPSLEASDTLDVPSATLGEGQLDGNQNIPAVSAPAPEVKNNEAESEAVGAVEPAPAPLPEPAVGSAPNGSQEPSAESSLTESGLNVQFGDGDTFVLHLYDNETAAKIAEYVGTAAWQLPIDHYDDYDNWEVMQFYDIPSRYDIPSKSQQVTSEKAGTVYYSEPNRIVLFYQDAEVSSDYTPVGYIDYSEAFVDAVVNNPVVPGWSNKLVHISTQN